jgi:hypothetical protein
LRQAQGSEAAREALGEIEGFRKISGHQEMLLLIKALKKKWDQEETPKENAA